MKVYTDRTFYNKHNQPKYGFYIDETLARNLDFLKRAVYKQWDGVFLITGSEGTAKSTLSQMVGYYLDDTININRICFSGKQLLEAIDNAKRGDVIILDEAILTMSTQDFGTEIQSILIKKFTLIRSKALFIILIIPNPFMLRRYFLVFRTKFLLHCYSPNGLSRGFCKFYSFKRKKEMYFLGYKTWNMNVVQPNFSCRFTDTLGWFINQEEYEKKKEAAVLELTENSEHKKDEQHKKQIIELKTKYQDIINKMKESKKNETTEIDIAWKNKYLELKDKNKQQIDTLKAELKNASYKRANARLTFLEDYRDMLLHYIHMNIASDNIAESLRVFGIGNMNQKEIEKSIEKGKILTELYKKQLN